MRFSVHCVCVFVLIMPAFTCVPSHTPRVVTVLAGQGRDFHLRAWSCGHTRERNTPGCLCHAAHCLIFTGAGANKLVLPAYVRVGITDASNASAPSWTVMVRVRLASSGLHGGGVASVEHAACACSPSDICGELCTLAFPLGLPVLLPSNLTCLPTCCCVASCSRTLSSTPSMTIAMPGRHFSTHQLALLPGI